MVVALLDEVQVRYLGAGWERRCESGSDEEAVVVVLLSCLVDCMLVLHCLVQLRLDVCRVGLSLAAV